MGLVKYDDEFIKESLMKIYEVYGEFTTKSIKESHNKYNTLSISVLDRRYKTKEALYNLIGLEKPKNKTFKDWCKENNKQNLLEAWDYELNDCSPEDILYSCHQKYYFKCLKHTEHKSQLYLINSFTNMGIELHCITCNSFGQWCLDNDKKDILDRWDYELNKNNPFEVASSTHKLIYFKCPRKIHESEKHNIKSFVHGIEGSLDCTKCNSFAQYGIDNLGDDFLTIYWDYNKNTTNPWKITKASHEKVWIKCLETDYHGSYEVNVSHFTTRGVRCTYCGNMSVHLNDSLGMLYPEVLYIWSNKNKKSPYEYKPCSSKKVWLKCRDGKHDDSLRTLGAAILNSFNCTDCVRERKESYLQEKVRTYVNLLNHNTVHENKCSIVPINPKTHYPLPFDNEVVELKLIIEVHGQQHYDFGMYTGKWKVKNMTPEQSLKQRKLYDRYKKAVAEHNGYFYLEIPYWTEKDESYKTLIDNKIDEIKQLGVT